MLSRQGMVEFVSYFNMDHAQWVEQNTGKPLSDLGKRVAYIIGVAGRGIYNAPIRVEKIDWSNNRFIEVKWRGEIATWDFNQLTLLVALCHYYCIRMSIEGIGPGYMRMFFHQRKGREGGMAERHPDMETAWAQIRAALPPSA